MLKQFKYFFLCFSFLALFSVTAKASHVAGGEITYTCLGGNQYQVNLNLFIDCAGFNPGASQTIDISSTCGGTATLTVNVTPATTNGLEISQLCPAQIGLSTCSGGTLPGMWLFSYNGIVTLAPPCDTWTMSWSTCCRNLAITNLSSASSNYYIEATLNSATAPCNSSPAFTAQPIPYVCNGQPVNYSYGVVETDGDSLYYSLISAMDAAGVSSTYNAGYSGTSPIPGITINPLTGLISFTPTTLGNFVVVILVQEYDSAGNLIGTVMRDIQFVVQNCTNVVPSPAGGTITGFSGSAVQTGPYSVEMCAGNSFNFTATYTDPDGGDSLSYISNILAACPGAVVTSSGLNPLTLNISWTAPGTMSGTNITFTMTISDNACPIPGQQTFVYSVNILDATTTNPDLTICGSQTAQLNAYGGSVFNWSVVSGSPMTPANFSCNPCANPIASPAVTTTYAVISNLSGTCDNVDTVTVFVVPNFTFNVTESSPTSCLMDPVQLSVNSLSPAGAYTFSWSPATYLDNPAIANPVATFTAPGTYTYTVTITSPFGCIQTSTLTIVAAPAYAPQFTAHADTAVCAGSPINLSVTFNGGSVASCGASLTGGCGGAAFIGAVGTGATLNTNTSYPAPYGNWYTTVKQQYLYTAAELNAAGITSGKIDQIDFNVTTINGITTYHNYNISMGCTALTTFNAAPSAFESGLTNVFSAPTFNVATGWNAHIFSTAYEWDGLSNIIIEVCFNELNPGANYTYNCETPSSPTTYISSQWSLSDAADQCTTAPSFFSTASMHPNIQLHYCSVVSDPADFTYMWTPSSGAITSPTSQNTTANPPTTMDYYATVTYTAGGCTAVDTVHADVINISTLNITPAGPYCVNGNLDTLQVSVPTGFGSWSGSGIVNTTLGTFNPTTAGVGTHQIIFTISGACGSAADTINIVVTPQPNATITPVGNQCASGAAITLSAATSGGTWSGTGITSATAGTFDPAIAGVGNFIITYTLTTPCTNQDTVLIHVTSQLNATITHVGPFCTASNPVTLTTVDPGGVWSGPGVNAAGVFDPSVAGVGNQVVTYTISGLCGSTDTDTISVIATPLISFTSDTTEGCEPTLITFSSTNNQPGGNCFWNFGDGNTSTNCNPTNEYTTAGQYNVTFMYSNTTGCSDTIIQNNYITIHSQPVAIYSQDPQPTSILSPQIHFHDLSTGQIDSWSWSFGVMGNSSLQDPIIVYPDTGTYAVQLIVTNIYGCADTANSNILIDPVLVFYAPNAFTPNTNGLNDEFRVYGDGIDPAHFEMRIYNRWGELLYRTNDINKGWNGAKGNVGDPVEQDVYVWKVDLKDFQGLKHSYIGHVTVIK